MAQIKDLNTKEQLWALRNEITLNSLFINDYSNTFDIDAKECCTFFEGYVEYLEELAEADGGVTDVDTFMKYDNATNLYDWWLMVAETL